MRERRWPPPVYTLHTTSSVGQSGAGAGRQTWKAHSYNGGSIRWALGRRRQGRREGRAAGRAGALSEWSLQCRASPSVFWQGARARATHTHNHKHKQKQTDTHSSLGGCNALHYSPLNLITQSLRRFIVRSSVCAEEKKGFAGGKEG